METAKIKLVAGMNNYSKYSNIQNPLNNLKSFYKGNNILVKFILINLAVWIGIRIMDVIFYLFQVEWTQPMIRLISVPAGLEQLLYHFWTPFTYMFVHFDFWHLLFNMVWLFLFGRIFLEFLSERQFLATYIFGGLSGAAVYILSYNIFPSFQDDMGSIALGASASVTAIVIATAFYVPNYRVNLIFLGSIPILYIAIVPILLDILAIKGDNSGGHLAHLGGAAWGLFYIYMLRKGKDYSTFFNKFPRINFNSTGPRTKKTRFRNVYTNTKPVSDEQYNYKKTQDQARVDKILDKISKSGYDSLTKEEKELLFKSSNNRK